MIFSENNLYGWGTTDIAMPRAAFAPHPDRLRKTGKITGHKRRGAAAYRWHSSSISRIFLDDYPWSQAFLLCLFSSLIIAYICLLHSPLPNEQIEQLIKPVEILVAMQKVEPQTATVSVEPKPLASSKPEHIETSVSFEHVAETPQEKIIDKPKEVRQDVPEKILKIVPDPKSPPVKIKQDGVQKKTKAPPSMASVMPSRVEQTKPANVKISPPIHRKRNYTKKDQNTIPQARTATKVAGLISAKDKRPIEKIVDIGSHQGKKNYYIQNNEKLGVPQGKTTTNLLALNQSDKTVEPASLKTKSANQRYGTRANTRLPKNRSVPPSASQQLLFPSQKGEEVPGVEPKKLNSQFNKPSSSLPNVSKRTKRASQRKTQGLSFQPKTRKNNPTLTPPVSNKLRTNANRSADKSASSLAKVHKFSEMRAIGEIEPSELINLKEFDVCIDPEMEFRQKTQLAANLDRPSRIEAEGVVFFIRYTESGYTIEIGIYNPQGRLFKDRCDVLELAINSFVNRVN
jgi:hypothetical protein